MCSVRVSEAGQTDIQKLHIAIIGSGPAGYYTAEALAAAGDRVAVDVIDRLATPFGLIRTGVAPDHQSIKGVTRRFEKTAKRDNVRFVGNLAVGSDISIEELMDIYDAVVLATGAMHDRSLGIKGETLPGVRGSAELVGWYNSHPDYAESGLRLDMTSMVVIGNGNVALDVARVLAKTPEELSHSDILPDAGQQIARSQVRDIWIVGRRGPQNASFTNKELSEMGQLAQAVALADPGQFPSLEKDDALEPGKRKMMAILRAFTANDAGEKPIRVHFCFFSRPVAILGEDKVTAVKFEKTRVENGAVIGTGVEWDIPCDLVVPCIGYLSSPIGSVPFDERAGRFVNEGGRIADRLYAVGWARRGPTGTIGTNKPDGAEVAARLLAEVTPTGRKGRKGLDELIAKRQIAAVTFRDWEKIDEAEIKAAQGTHPRLKFTRLGDMLKATRR